MEITQAVLPGDWHVEKNLAQQKWSLFGAEDHAHLNGKIEKLAALLREPYGYGKVQGQIETDIWVQVYQQEHSDGRNRALPLHTTIPELIVQDFKIRSE